jgi:hypothetical protein
MIDTITHFRGSTFRLQAAFLDDQGQARSLEGWAVRGVLKPPTGGAGIQIEADIVHEDEGLFELAAASTDTLEWPVGTWPLYLEYQEQEIDGDVIWEHVANVLVKDIG